MAKKEKEKKKSDDVMPVDLAARIGGRSYEPAPAPPPPPQPISGAPMPPRLDGPLPPRRDSRPVMIGMDEPVPPPLPPAAVIGSESAALEEGATKSGSGAIASPRTPPALGEIDLVVTPLPTPDDWHRFELALRRVRGVGTVKTEYYRHGVLKVRVAYAGPDRLGTALRAGIPGYRVRVLGEDKRTLQILVADDGEERRPG